LFYKVAWDIIKLERAFNALWSLDSRSFYLLNGALMVLLQKVRNPTRLKDFRPISLLHSFGNLFTKGLAMRRAPRLVDIVRSNQIAFVKERCIHDHFRSVQLACGWLHSVVSRLPCSRWTSPKRSTLSHGPSCCWICYNT
jgi:hypothetical protein